MGKAGLVRRKEAYGERFCGKKDGNPRTIASGEFVRGGIIPSSLAFLYTTGWIGWAGRNYLRRTRDSKKEIMIDVPLALTCMASGFAWPVYAAGDRQRRDGQEGRGHLPVLLLRRMHPLSAASSGWSARVVFFEAGPTSWRSQPLRKK